MYLGKFENIQQVNTQSANKQKGFTLIELVVVIVILGILAVTAAPKFIDLTSDARTATLKAVKASVQSVATLVHSKSLITGNSTDANDTVSVNNVDVSIRFGYPRDNDAAALSNWQDDLLDLDSADFTITRQNGGIIIAPADVVLTGSWPADPTNPQPNERNCYVRYQESDGVGNPPETIESVDCL